VQILLKIHESFNESENFNQELWTFHAFPEYGNMLFNGYSKDDFYKFKMIALDNWTLKIRMKSYDETFHDSESLDYKIYDIGEIHAEEIPQFFSNLNKIC
jgi:hypothetical protein